MAKTAGILFDPDGFTDSAKAATTYLQARGFSVLRQPFKMSSTVADVPRFPSKLDLMAWYSHGGWDGPVFLSDSTTEFPGQVSPDEPMEWVQLMTYFKRQMNPKGLFVVHACHAAGSDSLEKKQDAKKGRPKEDRIWIRDVAKHMDVYSFGQAGLSGAANVATVRLLLAFALTGKAKGYPFLAFAPGGDQMKKSSDWPKR